MGGMELNREKIEFEIMLAHKILFYSPDKLYRIVWVANPYVGCTHRCVYCYAASQSYYHWGDPLNFWKKIIVRPNAPSLLARELSDMNNRKEIVCMSTMCDPYNPGEQDFRVTRGMLLVLSQRGIPCHIITKSPLVVNDADLLQEIGKKSWCAVTFSTAFSEDLSNILEPNAPNLSERFSAMSYLSTRGITTGATIAPIIPGLNDDFDELEKIVARVRASGGTYIVYEFLSLHHGQAERLHMFLSKKMKTIATMVKDTYKGMRYPPENYVNEVKEKIMILAKKYHLLISPPEYVPYKMLSLDSFAKSQK